MEHSFQTLLLPAGSYNPRNSFCNYTANLRLPAHPLSLSSATSVLMPPAWYSPRRKDVLSLYSAAMINTGRQTEQSTPGQGNNSLEKNKGPYFCTYMRSLMCLATELPTLLGWVCFLRQVTSLIYSCPFQNPFFWNPSKGYFKNPNALHPLFRNRFDS